MNANSTNNNSAENFVTVFQIPALVIEDDPYIPKNDVLALAKELQMPKII